VATVCILTFTEIVRDPRVLRHIEALRSEHTIVTCGKGPQPDGVAKHYELPANAVQVPKTPKVIANLALRRTDATYRGSAAANAARGLLAGAAFDVLLTNDLLALPVGLDVAHDRPVLADLHEFAPRQMEGLYRWRYMLGPYMDGLCRRYLRRAAAITTVCEGIAEEYQAGYGVEVETITNASAYRDPQPRTAGSPIRLVHSGYAQPDRHLELMIRAAADVPGVVLDLYLVPADWTEDYLKRLKALAEASSNVRVLDPVPMSQLPATLDAYDAGLYVLPPLSVNSLHALPNKFFDFVQSGLGVIIGPSPEMARLTKRHGLGLVVSDFEERTLRAALDGLRADQVSAWKAAACRAAATLSSGQQAEHLRGIVHRLAG
jgi:hypothetical protein